MYDTHGLAEWAAFLSLGVGVHAALSVPYFLLVESESVRDFDPRPAVRRVLAVAQQTAGRVRLVVWDVTHSESLYPLWREWDNAPHAVRHFLRDAACGLAALYVLTIPGSTR